MNTLVYTYMLIWFIEGNLLLPSKCQKLISTVANDIFVSTASLFKIAIKIKIKKLHLQFNLETFLQTIKIQNIAVLAVAEHYLFTFKEVPSNESHKEPFDRLFIATVMAEKMPFITINKQFNECSKMVEIIR